MTAAAYSPPNHGPANHGSAYRHALTDTGVMIARSLRRSVRDPEAFITALALPVILMLLFVYVFGGAFNAGVHAADAGAGSTGGGYANYVVPGLIVLCAAYGAGTTAVAVATDMSTGIVDRFRSMPIAAPTVLAGQIVASVARNLLATALVIGAGLAVGWRPTGGPLDWVAAAGLIVLFIAALSWLAACFGLVAGGPEAANGAAFILMFIPYLSTAFVPSATMTRVLRPVAADQPFTPLIEAMRGLWMGRTSTGAAVGHEALLAVAYFGAILIFAAALASWLFRHRTAGH
jgi:ABC-2 type transport system permease protein